MPGKRFASAARRAIAYFLLPTVSVPRVWKESFMACPWGGLKLGMIAMHAGEREALARLRHAPRAGARRVALAREPQCAARARAARAGRGSVGRAAAAL